MLNFERSTLSKKISLICLLSTGTALLAAFSAFASISIARERGDEAKQLASFADVIGSNSVDALLAHDARRATATLATLRAKDDIARAALYDADGRLLARYGPGDAPAPAPDEAQRWWSPRMRLVRPIEEDGSALGTVLIEADLSAMWFSLLNSLFATAAAMAGSLCLAMLLASRVRVSIARPVGQLIATARRVTESQDFSQRISHRRHDELGTLIDSFNAMLAQIEQRGLALAQHRSDLEQQVNVRTAQLEKARNAAEAASRAKSAFLATMSHEIRTPMNGVLGMTDMLLGTALSDTQRHYTSMVRRSGEHLLVIINDILDFSKIEAGKLSVEYIHFNLWDLIDDIDNVYRPQAQAKGIRFVLDVAADIPLAVCGDPNHLRQVAANLIGNAIKFTERGEIVFKLRIVHEDGQSAGLRFEVHDSGIGVSRDARSRIFEAFSQADNSTTRKYGGTGLGLAISKQLVELMGGAIGVEHALPQGSVFWFTVCFDKRRVETAKLPQGLRVLVVDDQRDSRDALLAQLAAWQINADHASNALTAADRLRAQSYDVTLIDVGLGHGAGLSLAASLDAQGTRIVLIANARNAADPVQRRESGADYQIVKPLRAGDLYECLLRPAVALLPQPTACPTHAEPPAIRGVGTRRRKVLLAEDNPVNVEVASIMLDSLGLVVECARNGEEAVQAVRNARFDAVLMDCQMPVMDGFAATAEIRRTERERKLPIIAITANALQGDRESCLAAGMDDYLSKPFTQQELASVLGRWVALSRQPHKPAPLPTPEADRAIINHRALDHIRALSGDHGEHLVRKVVAAYVDDTPQHLQTLRSAIRGQDANNLRRAAHSLKSSSANVGADALAALCKEMEQLGRTETTEGASGILTHMEREFQAVRHTLTEMLEKEA